MKAKDAKIGMLVKIREWADMAEEFGLDEDGDIECKYHFTAAMQGMCGLLARVVGCEGLYMLCFIHTPTGLDTDWAFSADMIEPAQETAIDFLRSRIEYHKSEIVALETKIGELS